MKLHEWEIWHVYSTFLKGPRIDPFQASQKLIESGLSVFAQTSKGEAFWLRKGRVRQGHSTVTVSRDRQQGGITLNSRDGDDTLPRGFVAQAGIQAGHLRFFEKRIFGDHSTPASYTRAFLTPFELISEELDGPIIIYPIIKLFSTGAVLISYRLTGGTEPLEFREFLAQHVNLFEKSFASVRIPPRLAEIGTQAYWESEAALPVHLRARLPKLQRGHSEAVAQRTTRLQHRGYSFPMSPFPAVDESESLSSISLTVFQSIAYLLSRPRAGLAFVIRGQRSTFELGSYWSGRPHIHLLRFSGQRASAAENLDRFSAEFGQVFLRCETSEDAAARDAIPPDTRIFDDYNALIGSVLSMWVWSTEGLQRQRSWADSDNRYLVFSNQVTVEMLEYGFILHRALFEQASAHKDRERAYSARLGLVRLRQDLREASPAGEIRDLLNAGSARMGTVELQKEIQVALSIRTEQISVRDSQTATRVGQYLVILFGLVAVPPLATELVQPMWKLLAIPRPGNEHAASIVGMGISILLVLLLVVAVRLLLPLAARRRTRKS